MAYSVTNQAIIIDGTPPVLRNAYWPQFAEIDDDFIENGPSEWLQEKGYINFECTNGRARYRITTLRESIHSHTYELVEGFLSSNAND